MNYFKTGMLLIALTMILVWVGGFFGGRQGAMIAFLFAAILNFGAYWASDKIVLAMYGAKPLGFEDAPNLFRIVEEITTQANLPMPKIYILAQDAPNAFATGRDPKHAAVAVTEGILNLLNEEELKGVIAHELSHIRNRDTLISTIAATIAGAITMLAFMARWAAIFGGVGGRDSRDRGGILGLIAIAIFAPIAATIIQLAISRTGEFRADATGAKLTKNPGGLANALEKLEEYSQRIRMDANPSTAHLFIVNPLRGRSDFIVSLFSTHPPIQERIRRLQAMQI